MGARERGRELGGCWILGAKAQEEAEIVQRCQLLQSVGEGERPGL